jgi:recombination protein RecT
MSTKKNISKQKGANMTSVPAVVKEDRNITDQVLSRVTKMATAGALLFPANYSPENAMKSAWLKLRETKNKNGKYALDCCTRESVCNALLDMVVQGLSPGKNQCYFIVYGDQLQLHRSYMGTVAVARRVANVKNVTAQVIYGKDLFEIEEVEDGEILGVVHETSFDNIDINDIKGAYAVVTDEDGQKHYTVMTMDQIRKAWSQGATGGNSPAHKNFTDEMAKKTVINRACKLFINTSDDSDILAAAFNRTTENEHPERKLISDASSAPSNENASEMDALLFGGSATPAAKPSEEPEEPEEAKPDNGDTVAEVLNNADDLPEFLQPDFIEEGGRDER